MHLKANAPIEGDYICSAYQFHTSDGRPFGGEVTVDIRLKEDGEECKMVAGLERHISSNQNGSHISSLREAGSRREEETPMLVRNKPDFD